MKKYLVVVGLVVFGFGAFGQVKDSIPSVQKQIDDINVRMNKHYKEYRIGTFLVIGGALVTGIGSFISSDAYDNLDTKTANTTIIIGSAMLFVGTVIHIDSHKYFDKRRKFLY